MAPIRSVYDQNFSSIGAIIKKSSWGLGVGGEMILVENQVGVRQILSLDEVYRPSEFQHDRTHIKEVELGGWGLERLGKKFKPR